MAKPIPTAGARSTAVAGAEGGGTDCYFVTLEQCRAAISGNGGFCRQNGFYDGRPVTTGSGRAR